MLEWLIRNTDSLVAAANFTAVVFLTLLAGVTFYLLQAKKFSRDSAIRVILYGIILETLAWAAHRTYWGSWRLAREWDDQYLNNWFVQNGYLALIPSALVLVGLALILSPLWAILAGHKSEMRTDYLIPFGLIVGTYVLIWSIIDERSHRESTLPPPAFYKEN